MRARLRRIAPGEIDHEVIWGSIGLTTLLASRFLTLDAVPRSLCPLHALARIPCPTCGMTRCFLLFAHGEMGRAFAMNPGGAVLFAFLALFVPYATLAVVFRLPRLRITISESTNGSGGFWKTAARISVVTALAANWAYLIAVGR